MYGLTKKQKKLLDQLSSIGYNCADEIEPDIWAKLKAMNDFEMLYIYADNYLDDVYWENNR